MNSDKPILYDADKLSKKLTRIAGFLIAIGLVLCLIGAGVMTYFLRPVSSDTASVEFTIESGWGKNKVVEELDDKDLIRSSFFFKLYLKLRDSKDFLAGTYELNKAMSADEIINKITSSDSLDNKQISVTLIEGKRFKEYASKLAEKFNFTAEEFINKGKDKTYLNELSKKYFFIGNEIFDENILYPLEGYIFADTYSFRESSTVEDVYTILLNGMSNKLEKLGINKDSDTNVHDLLTLASIVELEAKTKEDRKMVAGIFKNRLNKGITLGSDVTTYYATQKQFIEKLSQVELDDCNAYNTRGTCVKGLPVGPICTPSYDSIDAALNPTESNYIYFVADKNGKTYFGVTEADHQRNISNLKSQGLWLG